MTVPAAMTKDFSIYAVQFSPFDPGRFACASAMNFGMAGAGRLWIYSGPDTALETAFDTPDAVFACNWSELDQRHVLTGNGDGAIRLWDTTLKKNAAIRLWKEHDREVFGLHWNLIGKQHFLSASWDGTLKLWDPNSMHSLRTWSEHLHCCYDVKWSPRQNDVFASVAGDQFIRLWDVKQPRSIMNIPMAHQDEILCLDWNKYSDHMVVTGSADLLVKAWDLRNPAVPLHVLKGHELAIRRLACSPHFGNLLVSTGYDMTVRLWDLNRLDYNGGCVDVFDRHTEFVLGLDWSLYQAGEVLSGGWDERVYRYVPMYMKQGRHREAPRPPMIPPHSSS